MENIVINGISINVKHFKYTEDEILDGRLRNLLNYVIEQARK